MLELLVVRHDAAGKRQHHCDRMIRYIRRAIIRRIAHRNAFARAGRDIDLIETDARSNDLATAQHLVDCVGVNLHIMITNGCIAFSPESLWNVRG